MDLIGERAPARQEEDRGAKTGGPWAISVYPFTAKGREQVLTRHATGRDKREERRMRWV